MWRHRFPSSHALQSVCLTGLRRLALAGGAPTGFFVTAHPKGVSACRKRLFQWLKPILSSHKTSELKLRPRKSVLDRKSTRLNSSHVAISYAVFCLKKKKNKT